MDRLHANAYNLRMITIVTIIIITIIIVVITIVIIFTSTIVVIFVVVILIIIYRIGDRLINARPPTVATLRWLVQILERKVHKYWCRCQRRHRHHLEKKFSQFTVGRVQSAMRDESRRNGKRSCVRTNSRLSGSSHAVVRYVSDEQVFVQEEPLRTKQLRTRRATPEQFEDVFWLVNDFFLIFTCYYP